VQTNPRAIVRAIGRATWRTIMRAAKNESLGASSTPHTPTIPWGEIPPHTNNSLGEIPPHTNNCPTICPLGGCGGIFPPRACPPQLESAAVPQCAVGNPGIAVRAVIVPVLRYSFLTQGYTFGIKSWYLAPPQQTPFNNSFHADLDPTPIRWIFTYPVREDNV